MKPFAILLCLLMLISPCLIFAADAKPAPAAVSVDAANDSFGRTFNIAVDKAQKAGEIGWVQAFRLKVAAKNPARIMQIKQAIAESAVDEGLKSSAGDMMAASFDWTQLLAFIQQLLPIILQIISIFS